MYCVVESNAIIRELLMGLQRGATAAQGVTEAQRRHIIGQSTDANIMSWLIKQIQHSNTTHETPNEPLPTNKATSADSYHKLPATNNPTTTQTTPPPQPRPWQPLHPPNEWIYTNGSLKKKSTSNRSSGNTFPHQHRHLHRCIRPSRNSHSHESRTCSHSSRTKHIQR